MLPSWRKQAAAAALNGARQALLAVTIQQDHWAIATADQEEEQLRIPLRVLLGEARYVFREYPEIVKKCGSDYKRHQQRLRRQTDPEVTESDVNELAPKAEASGTEVVSK